MQWSSVPVHHVWTAYWEFSAEVEELGSFFGCKGYFVRKTFMRKLPPYRFSVTAGTSHFPLSCCRRLERRKFGTWNLVTIWNKVAYARLCKNIVRSKLTEVSASASQFWSLAFHSHSLSVEGEVATQVMLSARISNLAEVALRCFLLRRPICGMLHIICITLGRKS